MTVLNVLEASTKLNSIINEAVLTHKPIVITSEKENAVLISEEDWNAISETLHLSSIPDMRETIKDGLSQDLSDCSKELDW